MSTENPVAPATPASQPPPDPQPTDTSTATPPADLADIKTKTAILASSVAPATSATEAPAATTTAPQAATTPEATAPQTPPVPSQTSPSPTDTTASTSQPVQPTTDPSGRTAVIEPGTEPEKSGNGGKILKMLVLGIVLLLFLGFVGGTAFAYFSKDNVPIFSEVVELGETAVWNMSKNTSNDAFKALFAPVAGAAGENPFLATILGEKLTYGDLEGALDPSAMEIFKYQLDITMGLGTTSEEAFLPLGDLVVGLKGEVQTTESDNRFSSEYSGSFTTDGTTLSAAGELRIIGQDAYIMLTTLPQLGFFDLTPIKDKWLHSAGDDASGLISDPDEVDDSELSEDGILLIETLLNSPTIAENMTKLPDEIFGTVRAHCFQVDLDQAAVRDIVNELNDAMPEDERSSAQEIEESVSEVGRVLVDWCLGRVDHLPYKAHFVLTPSETSSDQTDLDLTLTMWDYNVPVNIEVPADSVPLEDAMEEIMLPLYEDMPSGDGFGSEFDDSMLYDPTIIDDSDYDFDFDDEEMFFDEF